MFFLINWIARLWYGKEAMDAYEQKKRRTRKPVRRRTTTRRRQR